MSQKALAKRANISTSYMNLIESGRRTIGGSLIKVFADSLEVEVSEITKQHSTAHVERFVSRAKDLGASKDDATALITEYPKWIDVFDRQENEIAKLRNQVHDLQDMLSRDEVLSESVHVLLTRIASIRSTASILNTQGQIGAEKEAKFREILHSEARQASDVARQIVEHFEQMPLRQGSEVDLRVRFSDYLFSEQYYISDFEDAKGQCSDAEIVAWLQMKFGNHIEEVPRIHALLREFCADIRRIPQRALLKDLDADAVSVMRLAHKYDTTPTRVVRRIAMLCARAGAPRVSLNIMDQMGQSWLSAPLSSAHNLESIGCVHWPIYQVNKCLDDVAMRRINIVGDREYFALASSGNMHGFDAPSSTILRTQMSFVCNGAWEAKFSSMIGINGHVGCRICPEKSCIERRFQVINGNSKSE